MTAIASRVRHFVSIADLSSAELRALLDAAAAMVDPINAYFDAVLVMADDPAVRGNRLKLPG